VLDSVSRSPKSRSAFSDGHGTGRVDVAASRLREVRALRGFTRIDSIPDLGERTDVSELEVRIAPLGLKDVDWLPGIDFRGEGIFLRLEHTVLTGWEAKPEVMKEAARLTRQFEDGGGAGAWTNDRSLACGTCFFTRWRTC
jgi:hypothetical protein